MQKAITAAKAGRITFVLLALVIFSTTGACNRVAPVARTIGDDIGRVADDIGHAADDLGRETSRPVRLPLPSPPVTLPTEATGHLPQPTGFGRKLADWGERYGLDRSVLRETICDAVADAIVSQELPTPGDLAASVAGSLVSRGIQDEYAQTIASDLIKSILLGEGVSPPDELERVVGRWKQENC